MLERPGETVDRRFLLQRALGRDPSPEDRGVDMMVSQVRRKLTREVAEDCDFEAQAVDRRVSLHADQNIRVLGSNDMLRTAIENIVRHAP